MKIQRNNNLAGEQNDEIMYYLEQDEIARNYERFLETMRENNWVTWKRKKRLENSDMI